MEISQTRAFGSEGRKSTHDFLSLYSHSTSQQDPRPPSQDNYLKTHDFLQPLERVEMKSSTKEEEADDMSVDQGHSAPPPSVEHLLPGGIGTYTISHIPYVNRRATKRDGLIFPMAQSTSMDRNEENPKCSSYTGSGFTLWEESAAKKRKAGKNMARTPTIGDSVSTMASQWAASSERPSQSSSDNMFTCHTSYSSQTNGQKNQSFIDIIKSAKVDTHEEEVDGGEEFTIKSESKTIVKGNLRVKVDGKSTERKPNTPRSKHSATEQRRRSKINDRFQMLRELIPRSDQKKDKASFLLEVIDYIHFLQEKVHKYEGFQGWKHEPEKLMPLRNNPRPEESTVHQSCGVKNGSTSALLFAGRIDEKNVTTSPTMPMTVQHPMELEMNTATNLKASDQHPGTTKKAMALPLQPNFFTPLGTSGAVSQLPLRLASENTSQSQPRQPHTYACVPNANASGDKLKGKDVAIEGGTIGISNVYSQGLLNTLTQTLQSSGVDLSQASISVQIDLGRQANISSKKFCRKGGDIPACNQVMTGSTVARSEESDQPFKKLQKGKS